ncbi:restriction endonuclease [Actinobacillus minor]|uniref:restriction endonuclease n=1 Tax=Actinobacillus minor TaxID=51047 RepID=UPI0026F23DAD|nr:restriction endonuclease [Actinobacillus minor]
MKQLLTIEELIENAIAFCEFESKINHSEILGVTDGKAIGTYIEHKFKSFLQNNYIVNIGNSAIGIDLPDNHILTDIKVTSFTQPQSSCPFKNARQKIFGLGYNLLVFVYKKQDIDNFCKLDFIHCTFIDMFRTADYTTTRRLREMIYDGANKEDIIGFLEDRQIPGDDITHNSLADEILINPPEQGYLTISNALQWRLQYSRVIKLNNSVNGVVNYDW